MKLVGDSKLIAEKYQKIHENDFMDGVNSYELQTIIDRLDELEEQHGEGDPANIYKEFILETPAAQQPFIKYALALIHKWKTKIAETNK